MKSSWRNNNRLQESPNDDRVRVYVSTYKKYNEGSLEGAWLNVADYDSLEDFYDACRELHSDEEYPELMFQDCENLPDSLYSESGLSEEAFDFAKWADESYNDVDAGEAYIDLFGGWDEDDFEETYVGEYDSVEDYAWQYIEECGGIGEAVSHPENYFDYEHFGRELKWDLNEDKEWENSLLEMSDYDAAETYIDDVYGGIEEMAKESPETVENYFDIGSFANDLKYDISEQDGYIFLNR